MRKKKYQLFLFLAATLLAATLSAAAPSISIDSETDPELFCEIVATLERDCSADPPPIDPPPIDPPPDPAGPLVTFGPVSAIVEYPASIAALKRRETRWQLSVMLNSTRGTQGLASRDQSGADQAGHLSIYSAGGVLTVRHQDIAGGAPEIKLTSPAPLVAGEQYEITVSISATTGTALFVDGELAAHSPVSFGLAGNDLPLVVGGLCWTCTADGSQGPTKPISGSVFLAIYAEPADFEPPNSSGVLELSWQLPTEREDDTPLFSTEIQTVTAYQVNPPPRQRIGSTAGDVTGLEVLGLEVGVTYCFEITVTDTGGLVSEPSAWACKPARP